MDCDDCGETTDSTNNFCPNCGAPLKGPNGRNNSDDHPEYSHLSAETEMEIDGDQPLKNIDNENLDAELIEEHVQALDNLRQTSSKIEANQLVTDMRLLTNKTLEFGSSNPDSQTIDGYQDAMRSLNEQIQSIDVELSNTTQCPPVPQFKDTYVYHRRYVNQLGELVSMASAIQRYINETVSIEESSTDTKVTSSEPSSEFRMPDESRIVSVGDGLDDTTTWLEYLVKRDIEIVQTILEDAGVPGF